MLSAKSTRVSRGAKEDLASDFFKVELPDQHAARIRYDLIHHVRNAVKAGQGSVTGLLFGAALPGQPVRIDRYELLPAEEESGIRDLSQTGTDGLSETRSRDFHHGASRPLGFFRTQATGFLDMTKSDRETARRYLGTSGGLFLIIRTSTHRPWCGSLYSWSAFPQDPARAGVEFPFDESLLRSARTDLNRPGQPRSGRPRTWKPSLPLGPLMIAMAPLVGGLAVYWLDLFHYPIARPASASTIQRIESPQPARLPPSLAGNWAYVPNGQYSGAQPQTLEMAVAEREGRLTGTVVARFKRKGILPVRFQFAGNLQSANRQVFNWETSDGTKGAVELTPEPMPDRMLASFLIRPRGSPAISANITLVRLPQS